MGKEMRAQFVPENLAEVVNAMLSVPPVSARSARPVDRNHLVSSRVETKQGRRRRRRFPASAASPDLETIASLVAAAPPPLAPPASALDHRPDGRSRGGASPRPPAAAPQVPARERPAPDRLGHPLIRTLLHPACTAPPMFSHALAHPESTTHAP